MIALRQRYVARRAGSTGSLARVILRVTCTDGQSVIMSVKESVGGLDQCGSLSLEALPKDSYSSK